MSTTLIAIGMLLLGVFFGIVIIAVLSASKNDVDAERLDLFTDNAIALSCSPQRDHYAVINVTGAREVLGTGSTARAAIDAAYLKLHGISNNG